MRDLLEGRGPLLGAYTVNADVFEGRGWLPELVAFWAHKMPTSFFAFPSGPRHGAFMGLTMTLREKTLNTCSKGLE